MIFKDFLKTAQYGVKRKGLEIGPQVHYGETAIDSIRKQYRSSKCCTDMASLQHIGKINNMFYSKKEQQY